jgi:glycosyltransferase involved in cell wall biosynthesis
MTRRQLKIGISIWSFTPNTGGLQAHAQNLCKHLRLRGQEVTVITRSATRIPVRDDYLFFNEPADDIHVNGVPVRVLCLSHAWSPVLWIILKLAARSAATGLAATLYEMVAAAPARAAFAGFDIIHHVGHATALAGFAAAQAAKRHGTPFLVQPTAHPFNFGDSKLDFRLYRQSNRLLVHTCYERDFFTSRGINCPIDVVYNGIEDRADGQGDRFRAKYRIEGPMILYIGRKVVDKGYPLMVEAFKFLKKKTPAVTLVCMGPSAPDTEVKPLPGVIELEHVSENEKHDALAACTCLCVPSEGESFGLVYMEAGRYRKPVIGRNLPVLRELLGQTNAALLLGQADDQNNKARLMVDELVEGLQKLLNHPELCQQIGDACHLVSESFLWSKVVERFEHAYQQALEIEPERVQMAEHNKRATI